MQFLSFLQISFHQLQDLISLYEYYVHHLDYKVHSILLAAVHNDVFIFVCYKTFIFVDFRIAKARQLSMWHARMVTSLWVSGHSQTRYRYIDFICPTQNGSILLRVLTIKPLV